MTSLLHCYRYRQFHFRLALLWAWCLPLAVHAQNGHPLDNSFSGEFTLVGAAPQRLILDMHYDGDAITGSLLAGRMRLPLTATLDPSNWSVVIDASGADRAGAMHDIHLEATMSEPGSGTERALRGPLRYDGSNGTFAVTID